MNFKRLQWTTDIIKRLIIFLCFYMVLCSPMYTATKTMSDLYLLLILFPAMLICYIIDRLVHNIFINVAIQLSLFAGLLAFSLQYHIMFTVLFVGFLAPMQFATLYYSRTEHTTTRENVSGLMFVLPGASILYCIGSKQNEPLKMMIFLSFAIVLLFLTNRYLMQYSRYFLLNRDITGIPYKQIKFSSHLLFALFLFLCVAAMLFMTIFPLDDWLSALGDFLTFIIRSINQLFKGTDHVSTPTPIPTMEETPPPSMMMPLDEGTSLFWVIIEKVFFILVTICGVLGGTFLIVYLLYRFYRFFYRKNKDIRDTVSTISPFIKREKAPKSAASPKAPRVSPLRTLFPTNADKIRKLFAQYIKERLETVPRGFTPTELVGHHPAVHKLLNTTTNSAPTEAETKLVSLYEKARYSSLSCTREDVAQTKECIKQLVNK